MTGKDRRKIFTYCNVTVVPQIGASRYFGCRHGEYLTRWWRILFGPLSWVLVGTKSDARTYIDDTIANKTLSAVQMRLGKLRPLNN